MDSKLCTVAVTGCVMLSALVNAAPKRRVMLSADYESRSNHTRITLSLTDFVPYSIRQPAGQVQIRFQSESVQADFDTVLVEDGAVEQILFQKMGRRPTVILQLGSAFRSYQPIVLKSPFRIIVDVTRRTPWEGRSKRLDPPQIETPAPPEPKRPDRPQDDRQERSQLVSPTDSSRKATAELAAEAARRDVASALEDSVKRDLAPSESVSDLPLGLPAAGGGRAQGGSHDGRIRTVVLDPGHGGSEVGAIGPNQLREKDVTLAIALKIQAILVSRLGLSVVLTRSDDRDLELDARTAIANHHQADLFVSIHANAARRPDARGAETYFLSRDATDDAASTLAAIENNAIGIDDSSVHGTDLELILWDLAQTQYLEESQAFGEQIQAELNQMLGIRNRGVKQAPFRVLVGATMPAVLVEAGFISNPQEARLLSQSDYQEKIADAVYQSILRFMSSRARRMGSAPS